MKKDPDHLEAAIGVGIILFSVFSGCSLAALIFNYFVLGK